MAGGARRSRAARLLFVDDDRSVRKAFARRVRSLGFTVDLASSGAAAIRLARRQHYPVIVTDLRMPGIDGLELIERLRPTHPDSAFVLVTGSFQIDGPRLNKLGDAVTKILVKPWDDAELHQVLTKAVEIGARSATCDISSVLLVEDNPGDANLIRRRIETAFPLHRPDIHVVQTLDKATRVLRDKPIDVILTDLSLPDALGLDAVRRLHSIAPDVPLVVLTGLQDDELGLRAVQLGAQDYLAKGGIDSRLLARSLRYATERARASQRLAEMAYVDQLTGLANRVLFRDRVTHAVAMGRRSQRRFAVMFLDLDNFKTINDTYGHDIGDDVLQEVAVRLQAAARASDTVARLGGDEFVLLVENVDAQHGLDRTIQQIQQAFSEPVESGPHSLEISGSLGVSFYPSTATTPDELLRYADKAMFRAKKAAGTSWDISLGPEPSETMQAAPAPGPSRRAADG